MVSRRYPSPGSESKVALPTYRFGHLESPLTTLARTAGFEGWAELVHFVRAGGTVTAQAPEICGRFIGNALLIRDGCEHYGIVVTEIRAQGAQEVLVLASEETACVSDRRLAS